MAMSKAMTKKMTALQAEFDADMGFLCAVRDGGFDKIGLRPSEIAAARRLPQLEVYRVETSAAYVAKTGDHHVFGARLAPRCDRLRLEEMLLECGYLPCGES
jgi:hypothetical protein